MRIRADRRQIEFQPQPEADRRATEICARMKEDQIALAKELRVLWSTAAYVQESCSGIGEYVLARGISPLHGMDLLYAGIAMNTFDWVEPGIRDGSVPIHRASLLGKVCALENGIEEGDEWESWARFLPYRRLRALVNRRLEEVKQRTKALIALTLDVTREALEDFDEARRLASRKAGRSLSKGETFAFVNRDFRRRYDPVFKQARRRRIGDTRDPSCRTVPAETIRACLEAYGDRCWVPGCQNEIFLEHAHLRPNREGGSQEAENIGRPCRRHHVMFDAGTMWIIGTNARGLPIFETREGWILHPDHPGARRKKSDVPPGGGEGRGLHPPPGTTGPDAGEPMRPSLASWRVHPARFAARWLRKGLVRPCGPRCRIPMFELGASHLRGPPRGASP